jgi:hypothetical protein
MRAIRSILGLALAALYALAFVVAYWLYAQAHGEWLADIWLSLAAIPYIVTTDWIFGSSDFSADAMAQLLGAAAFCCGLAYIVGALIEALLRFVYRRIKGWRGI